MSDDTLGFQSQNSWFESYLKLRPHTFYQECSTSILNSTIFSEICWVVFIGHRVVSIKNVLLEIFPQHNEKCQVTPI